MINYIKGILVAITEASIIVECNNIGYEIVIPNSIIKELPKINEPIKIFTELYVREDIMRLYGFLNPKDIDVFNKLITVSGIGPKAGMSILSTFTPTELIMAIITEDIKQISSAKGVGKKTAGKIILELKDKFSDIDVLDLDEIKNDNSFEKEASMALSEWGYSKQEITEAIKKCNDNSCVEDLIKEALSYLVKS